MGLVKRTYVDGETVITADNLNDIQDEIIQNASDISTKGTYSKPSGGIPSTDMTTAVQTSLGKADSAYQKPSGGIPATDLASAVQTSLGKADTAYQKPSGGIPSTDLDTALQSSDIDNTLTVSGKAADAKKTGDEISGVKNTLSHKADVIYDTASGDIASFPDGADGLPVKDLTVAIEPVQDLHGYDYPWPAGGGKNLFNKDAVTTGKRLGASGQELDDADYYVSEYIPVTVGTAYVKNSPTADAYHRFATYASDKSFVRISNSNGITIETGEAYIRMCGLQTELSTTQVEIGTTATAYAPYSNICSISGWTGCNISHSGEDTSDPTVITISWQSEAGTVYGGTLELPSGVLTVDRAGVDMGTLTWNLPTGTVTRFNATPNPAIKAASNRSLYIQCSCYAPNVGGGAYDPFTIYNVGNDIYVVDGTYESASDFTTAVTGQIAVYPLATPLVIQLDPVTVTTLLGQNNIWADCGPSTVEYPADTKLYIQKINTPTDDDMIADANIASGKYFIINNNLYLSTAAILAGDPIKPGTNCTLTNLAAALNALNS